MTPSDLVIFHRIYCNSYRHKTARHVTAEGETKPEAREITVIILSLEGGKAMLGA
jgi:hypothetical protein